MISLDTARLAPSDGEKRLSVQAEGLIGKIKLENFRETRSFYRMRRSKTSSWKVVSVWPWQYPPHLRDEKGKRFPLLCRRYVDGQVQYRLPTSTDLARVEEENLQSMVDYAW